MMAGNWKSYQDFVRRTDYLEPEYKTSEDYYDDFLTAYCGKTEYPDEDLEVIHDYWYRFCDGFPENEKNAMEMTIAQMKEELKEYDE